MLRVGSDFSGVGAFDQALIRLGIDYETVFACDMDKYSRKTYTANYGEPIYFPENVYDRIIPDESLDIYMTSPPCQAFSLAGKRLGKKDKRGILFFNSHEFIMKNKPRFFIFENVRGLLSDDGGRTFQEWVNYLGGKSVNSVHTLFPTDEAAPYHIYYRVLNAKKHGVPQNRERIFIVGIRDDEDNVFDWPMEIPLTKKLADVLEDEVDEKYFLSEKLMRTLFETSSGKDGCFKPAEVKDINGVSNALTARMAKMGRGDNYLKIKSATSKGHEPATENDSMNFTHPNSKTRRCRVGVGVGQTLDTARNQSVMVVKLKRTDEAKQKRSEILKATGKDVNSFSERQYEAENQSHSDTILASPNPKKDGLICIPVLTPNRVEKRQNGRRFKENGDPSFTITTQDRHGIYDGYSIRRLTPTECFRLMDFPDSLVENAREVGISDSQLYKQAGNSIVVACLVGIINGMKKLVK